MVPHTFRFSNKFHFFLCFFTYASIEFLSAQPVQSDFRKFVADRNQKFSKFESEARQRYEQFRDKANADYADFMRRKWVAFETRPAQPVPVCPEPPRPFVKSGVAAPATVLLDFEELRLPVLPLLPPPTPAVPIAEPTLSQPETFHFRFYGTSCRVRLGAAQRFGLKDLREETVAAAWQALVSDETDAALLDCLELRQRLQLGDWGYIGLLDSLGGAFFGGDASEAVLLQMYLLVQSGYRVRMARSTDNRLVLLVPFPQNVYNYCYIAKDGEKYYILDAEVKNHRYYVFDHAFPGENLPSLRQDTPPDLDYVASEGRSFSSTACPALQVLLYPNRQLMAFYNTYPLSSDWQDYVAASLSDEVKATLYPALKGQLAQRSQTAQVALLLDFVQTAFDYQTDGEQFGYERPLFGDETFFYPYSDCEDRAILFAILVRELVGLDAVLLHYPGHLATAVKFTEATPPGAYFLLDDGPYVVCDPTYIHAGVGECMPQYEDVRAQIVRL